MTTPLYEPIREETPQEKLRLFLQQLYTESDPADGLKAIRARFWDHFLEIGLPTRSKESYQYLPLRELYAGSYSKAVDIEEIVQEKVEVEIYPECKDSFVVLVNGKLRSSLSNLSGVPRPIVLSSLSQAMRTYGSFLQNRWSKTLKEETDPFAALNGAIHSEGAFLYIPPKLRVERPIQILNIIDSKSPAVLFPRVQIFVGAQSEATFLSTNATFSGADFWINQVHDLAIEEAAICEFIHLASAPASAWHFSAMRAQLKKRARLQSISLTKGSKSVRQDFRVNLMGEDAEAAIASLCELKEHAAAHAHVFMEHTAANCRSKQLFKGVVEGHARSSFEGKIYVHPEAQKTDAFQLNNHLILGPHAMANSKPNLEIFADDVKASHGSTVGQINAEDLFYFKTRGLPEEVAKKLLLEGFNREIIDLISIPSVRAAQMKRT